MNENTATIADARKLTPLELWTTEVAYAESELKKYHERAKKVVRRFLDERDALDTPQKWFNLFYANTKILRAALYAQAPRPEVKRKYLDYKDDVARVAALILQRAITPDMDDPRDTFHSTMRHAVTDRLVPGLAAVWLRLETDTEDTELMLEGSPSVGEEQANATHHEEPVNSGFVSGPAPDEQPPQEGTTPMVFKRITDQRVAVDYVYWEDFIWSPCRVWEERRWVGRKVYLSREELVKRFGEDKGSQVPLNHRPSTEVLQQSTPVNMAIQRACVYEIWDRIHRKIIWFCKESKELLDERDDFLNLIGFEPCPMPLLANIATSNTVPRPDYFMVQDQYSELDTVNNRISLLIKACKVVGVYDRSSDGVQRMLLEGSDNTLIPVDNWAMFAEKGGVKGQVDWLPLEQVVQALQRLYEARDGIKAQIYELTGIADIVRGASKASETLGAQEIKAKFASIRIKDIQDEITRFAAEALRIKAEIMVKHFDKEVLRRKSNIMRTDDAQLADIALDMLQSEEGFEWRIEVTADQLAQADYAMEKQDRIELLTAVSGYLNTVGNLIQTAPQAAPLLVGLLKWAVAGFRGAREIEGMLDRELDTMMKQPQQQEQGPSPEEQKAKADQERQQMELQGKQQAQQIDIAARRQKMQLDQAGAMQKLQATAMKNAQDFQANAMRIRQAAQAKRVQND